MTNTMASGKLRCHCGRLALYRVGEIGYCAAHRQDATARIAKFGNPRARKTPTRSRVRLRHVDKPTKRDRQKELRENPTPYESALRLLLRETPETKGQWEFQPIVHGYIPDFLHRGRKIIVELDGAPHFTEDGRRRDKQRTRHLTRKGYWVIRFPNSEVAKHPQRVLAAIIEAQDGLR